MLKRSFRSCACASDGNATARARPASRFIGTPTRARPAVDAPGPEELRVVAARAGREAECVGERGPDAPCDAVVGARAILAVAGDALRRQRREVAAHVAVHARQQPVHAGQLAADALVVEVRARPGPLRVALAAVGPERVVVDVVVAMAGDAQVAGARRAAARRDGTSRTATPSCAPPNLGVGTSCPVRMIFQSSASWHDRAQRAELPAMHVGLGVAAAALARRRLEVDRLMAVVAADLAVLALERPVAVLLDRCDRRRPCRRASGRSRSAARARRACASSFSWQLKQVVPLPRLLAKSRRGWQPSHSTSL